MRRPLAFVTLLASCAAVACSSDTERSPAADGGAEQTGPVDVRSLEIPASDLVFDAKVAGPENGEVVFLLHGFPETSYEWRYALPVLGEAGYRAIAPDQRGYSPRARPADVAEYDVNRLVDDVIAMADALDVERFHVVGHDWGAAVAWGIPQAAGDRLLSLTTVSVPHPKAFAQVLADEDSCQYAASAYFDLFVSPAATQFFLGNGAAGLRFALEGLPAEDIDVYVDALGSTEAIDGALAWYRANIENRKFKDTLTVENVTAPTLFVWSSADAAICEAGVAINADFMDGPYQFERIDGIAHWVPELAPEPFHTALLAHLRAFPDRAR